MGNLTKKELGKNIFNWWRSSILKIILQKNGNLVFKSTEKVVKNYIYTKNYIHFIQFYLLINNF
jgi:hypothetical protein